MPITFDVSSLPSISAVANLFYSQRLRSGTDTLNENIEVLRRISEVVRVVTDYAYFQSLITGTALPHLFDINKRTFPTLYYIRENTLSECETKKNSNNYLSVDGFSVNPQSPPAQEGDLLFLIPITQPEDFIVYIYRRESLSSPVSSTNPLSWQEIASSVGGGGGVKILKSKPELIREYNKNKNFGKLFYIDFQTPLSAETTDPQSLVTYYDEIKTGDIIEFYLDDSQSNPSSNTPTGGTYKVRVMNRLPKSPQLDSNNTDRYDDVIPFRQGMSLEEMALVIDDFAQKVAPPRAPSFNRGMGGIQFTVSGGRPTRTQTAYALLNNDSFVFSSSVNALQRNIVFLIQNGTTFPNPRVTMTVRVGEALPADRREGFDSSVPFRLHHIFKKITQTSLTSNDFSQWLLTQNPDFFLSKNVELFSSDELAQTIHNQTNPSTVTSDHTYGSLSIPQDLPLSEILRTIHSVDPYASSGMYSNDPAATSKRRFWVQSTLNFVYTFQAQANNDSPYALVYALTNNRIPRSATSVSAQYRSILLYVDFENTTFTNNDIQFDVFIRQSNSDVSLFSKISNFNSDYTHNTSISFTRFTYVSGIPYISNSNQIVFRLNALNKVRGRYVITRTFISNFRPVQGSVPRFFNYSSDNYDTLSSHPEAIFSEPQANNSEIFNANLFNTTLSLSDFNFYNRNSDVRSLFFLYNVNQLRNNSSPAGTISFPQSPSSTPPVLYLVSNLCERVKNNIEFSNSSTRRIVVRDIFDPTFNSSFSTNNPDITNFTQANHNDHLGDAGNRELQLVSYVHDSNLSTSFTGYVYPDRIWHHPTSQPPSPINYENLSGLQLKTRGSSSRLSELSNINNTFARFVGFRTTVLNSSPALQYSQITLTLNIRRFNQSAVTQATIGNFLCVYLKFGNNISFSSQSSNFRNHLYCVLAPDINNLELVSVNNYNSPYASLWRFDPAVNLVTDSSVVRFTIPLSAAFTFNTNHFVCVYFGILRDSSGIGFDFRFNNNPDDHTRLFTLAVEN